MAAMTETRTSRGLPELAQIGDEGGHRGLLHAGVDCGRCCSGVSRTPFRGEVEKADAGGHGGTDQG